MRLLASGRASDIHDLGAGRILRRFRAGGDPDREALVMRHARDHGYPVPCIHDVVEDGLVLERIAGATMAEELKRQPWTCARNALILARLHEKLHKIAAPTSLACEGPPGRSLLHLDLHPANVILASSGPVVIDWTNARAGTPMFDVAVTWIIGATSSGNGRLGRAGVRRFLSRFDYADVAAVLSSAADWRRRDRNVTAAERDAIQALLARVLIGPPPQPRRR